MQWRVITVLAGALLASTAPATSHASPATEITWATDAALPAPVTPAADSVLWMSDYLADPAQFQQPVVPRVEAPTATPTSATAQAASRRFWTSFASAPPSFAAGETPPFSASVVSGQESVVRASTDMGDLLGGSAAVLDLGLQRRNPVVNDPRVRGSQVGALAASGSYWVPARIDLDTMVSKIDSRLIDHATVISGPYSSLYGPGRQFVDFELLRTPRYDGGFQAYGSTIADYRTNGEQWYGRQSLWGGNDVWGFRAGYGHRTGNDYASGDGLLIPASYKSRDIDLALGAQVTPDSAFEGQALRLDQTDVELAGQAFDLDWLVTDGYELEYAIENASWADRVVVDAWYNQTRFAGSAQRPSKRKQFPIYDVLGFTGFTNVDSMSTGYRLIAHWNGANGEALRAGADLRYVKQQLNEITSGINEFQWIDQNSPIPKSDWVNPGLFVEVAAPLSDAATLTTGARVDYLGTAVLASPADLEGLGINSELSSLPAADIWGSDDLDQNDILALGYISLDLETPDGWGAGASVGYSERPPNLTERYAVETFMFMLQNGLNTVTGDPELDKEQAIQADLRVSRRIDDFRIQGTIFHAWIHDYITYEALQAVAAPPAGDIEQLNLKFVNTDLATLWGCEARAEYQWNDWLTPFATVKYVEGLDRSRNGSFDTVPSAPGMASTRTDGAVRGTGSATGVAAVDHEPLPNILPLESRLGLRWEERLAATRWGVEVYARVVDSQARVATSLLESPTPGFTVWDLRGFIRPSEHLQISAGVENFTDKQYFEHLDYRTQNPLALSTFRPGIGFYLGSELSY